MSEALEENIRELMRQRDYKRATQERIDELELEIAAQMTEKQIVINGIGMIQKRGKKDRKAWKHDEVFSAINRKITGRLLAAPTGEILTPDALLGVELIQRLANPSWRTTKLKEIDIDPDEYCESTFAGYSIIIGEGIEE